MDDLLLFTPSKQSNMTKLEDLLKALLKNGLKISPKKCKAKTSGIKLLAVHGVKKGVDPSVKPGKTNFKTHKSSNRTKCSE